MFFRLQSGNSEGVLGFFGFGDCFGGTQSMKSNREPCRLALLTLNFSKPYIAS